MKTLTPRVMEDEKYKKTLKRLLTFILTIGTITFIPVLWLPDEYMFFGFLGWYLLLCVVIAIAPSVLGSEYE